ncbi:hypothetical protein ONZ45_g16326 [Pleurotus djamor]|nr:hypothetical protein ONZ45_g16326 [Pleurotus djamor]
MSGHNPFSQWPASSQTAFPGGSVPSVFGALPFSGPAWTPAIIYFRFNFASTSILNSTVTGPDQQPYFHITTDNPRPGFTFFHNAQNSPVVVIEWQSHPIVEIRDMVPKQLVSNWLELSAQRNTRHVQIRGMRCVWTPGDESIILLNASVNPPERLGRVLRGTNSATLELTTYAIQAGITESALVSAFLLLSGRNIS